MGNAAAKEPSMEDILSSIRKIVSQEDEAADAGEEGVSDADAITSGGDSRPATPAASFAKLAHQARGKAAMAARHDAAPLSPAELDDEEMDISAGIQASEDEQTDPGMTASEDTPNPQEPEMNIQADSMAIEEMEHREETAMSDAENDSMQEHELVSTTTQQSVSDSFERMKRSVLENIDSRMDALMRPMLSSWLDQNLPGIVERIVREEVEKLAKID
jgi:uncharacterized protein